MEIKHKAINTKLKAFENKSNKNNFFFINNEIKEKEDYSKIINSKIKLSKLSIRYIIIILFFIGLINPVLSDNSFIKKRILDSAQTIRVKYYASITKLKAINSDYIPSRVYVNDQLSSIDKNGFIIVDKEGYYDIILQWDIKAEKYSKLFQNIASAIEIDFISFNITGIESIKNMFINCENLEYINFRNFDTSMVIEISSMFEGCTKLKSLDLSSFDLTNAKYMEYMFKNCYSLTSLNLTNFYTPNLLRMQELFYGCKSLCYLNISNFVTKYITNMSSIFKDCQSLTSLDITNFDTRKANDMFELFKDCSSLESLDLSNFDTSKVLDMEGMFCGCSSLTSLNVSNFITSNVESMQYMFYSCKKLTSIDLSNFETLEVFSMDYMFSDCKSLLSLDISSFYISQIDMREIFRGCSSLTSINFSREYKLVGIIYRMFYECSSLESLDLYNFDFALNDNLDYLFNGCYSLTSLDLSNLDTSSVSSMEYMFFGCKSLKELNITNLNTSQVLNMNGMFYNCSSLISLDLRGFNTSKVQDMSNLFSGCKKLVALNLLNFNTSLVYNMDSMFKECYSLTSLDLSSFDTSYVTNMRYMFFSCSKLTSLNLSNFSTKSLTNIDLIFYDCKYLEYVNLYHFSDTMVFQFSDMFHGVKENIIYCIKDEIKADHIISQISLKKCSINDCSSDWKSKRKKMVFKKNICLDSCMEDKTYKYEYDFYCYDKCPVGSHSSKDNIYICENNIFECVAKYPFIVVSDKSCKEDCYCDEFFDNICTINSINEESKSILIKNIINGIQEGLIDNLIENFIIKKNMNITKIVNDTLYHITSSFNQNLKDSNISTLELGECEKKLKDIYNIPQKDPLIIFKTEQYFEGLLIPLIEYEVFHPITKKKLNLDYCKKENINATITIPVSINEEYLFKYDPNSTYYNNICYTYTTKDNTDITLYDRQNEFNQNNMFLCSNNCIYDGYDSLYKRAICHCKVKERITLNSEIDQNELLFKFDNKKYITNFNVLKCSKLIFLNNGVFKNLGSVFILIILLLYISSAIFVYFKGYNLLLQHISDILDAKMLEPDNENYSKKDINDQSKENSTDIFTTSKKSKISNMKNNNLSKSNSEIKVESDININNNILNKQHGKKDIKENGKILEYIDFELNAISYQEALENDKRSYFEYYKSLIKTKHILIFSFSINQDYNLYIIKICLFFFSFSINLLINTFFFNDSMMHRIYEDKGSFNFMYILPQIIYSLIISSIIFIIVEKVTLTQNDILEIKHEKNKHNLNARVLISLRHIKIKFICFFSFSILFLVLFWLYLSCFCAVYKNTQLYLVKNSLISYLIFLILPFIFCIFPGFLRFSALKGPGECLYKISQIIQKFL